MAGYQPPSPLPCARGRTFASSSMAQCSLVTPAGLPPSCAQAHCRRGQPSYLQILRPSQVPRLHPCAARGNRGTGVELRSEASASVPASSLIAATSSSLARRPGNHVCAYIRKWPQSSVKGGLWIGAIRRNRSPRCCFCSGSLLDDVHMQPCARHAATS